MWRPQGPSGISLEHYVAQSRTHVRRRDRTGAVGAVISITRLHRPMLRNSHTSGSPVPAPPGQPNVRVAKAASGTNQQKTDLLYGTPVPGKPGLVTSPFAPDSGYVDVTGFSARSRSRRPIHRQDFPYAVGSAVVRLPPREVFGRLSLTISAKPDAVGAAPQRLIPTGERCGLASHIAATESLSSCALMKS